MRSLVRAVAGAAAVFLARHASAVVCGDPFAAGPIMATGAPSSAVVTGDFNGDTIPDIASVSFVFGQPSLAILLGNGDLTFQAPIVTALDNSAASVVAGDFNGDSKLDLVIGYSFGGGETLLGNGDGTFQPGVPWSADIQVNSLVAGFFNADAHLDIAAVGYSLQVLLGNGDGSFGAATPYPVPAYANGVAAGDLDGDGLVDLALTHSEGNNAVSLLRGHGDGTFESPVTAIAGLDLSRPVIADLNDDGKNDIVVISNGVVAVLLAKGNLSFQAPQDYTAGPNAFAATAADIDGDGHLDLVVTSLGGEYSQTYTSLRVLRNDGSGMFSLDGSYALVSAPSPPAVADFDSAGIPDVTVGGGSGDVVAIQNVQGQLLAPRLDESAGGGLALALGDFNEDGYQDVVLGGGGIGIALGGPDGSFRPGPSRSEIWSLSEAAVADFNGDGHLDVVGVAGTFANAFVFFAGNGDGTFQDPLLFPLPGPALTVSGIQLGDFNGDGYADAAIAGYGGFSNVGQLTVFVGDGQGGFTNSAAMAVDVGLIGGLAIGDFDGNGKNDVVTAGSQVFGGAELFFFAGRGDGTFDLPTTQPLGQFIRSIGAAALTAPGVLDLVAGVDTTTVFLPGNGDGSFGAPQIVANGFDYALSIADLDSDGKLDVIYSDQEHEVFLRGLGAGAFDAPLAYPSSQAAGPVLVPDVAGDGALDTVMGTGSAALVVMRSAKLAAGLPGAVSAIARSGFSITVGASGVAPLTYQWRKDGVTLSDGGSISGSHTATLTIDPVSFSDAGAYDVVVTDSCDVITSNSAALSVEFADVPPTSPFHGDIITIATAGITGGCGGGNYCPTSPVRRDQMAAFLLKSEHGSNYAPPACAGLFTDVPCPSAFADWVEQLAAEGVSSGCGGTNYCPSASVTRAQMAVFLLKTSQGSNYTPPSATGIFGDVPVGSFAADFIEDLYNRGITGGCQTSPLLYCPGNPVLRQQMATLLVRTFF